MTVDQFVKYVNACFALQSANYECVCFITSLFFRFSQKVTKSESKCKYNVNRNNNGDDEKWLIVTHQTINCAQSPFEYVENTVGFLLLFIFCFASHDIAPYEMTHWIIPLYSVHFWMSFVM